MLIHCGLLGISKSFNKWDERIVNLSLTCIFLKPGSVFLFSSFKGTSPDLSYTLSGQNPNSPCQANPTHIGISSKESSPNIETLRSLSLHHHPVGTHRYMSFSQYINHLWPIHPSFARIYLLEFPLVKNPRPPSSDWKGPLRGRSPSPVPWVSHVQISCGEKNGASGRTRFDSPCSTIKWRLSSLMKTKQACPLAFANW